MARTPRTLIREGRKEITSVMKTYLEELSVQIIKQIIKKAKKLPPSQMAVATKGITVPAAQLYKSDLKEAVAVIAREAISTAKKEVPSSVKFSEFDDLPPGVKKFLGGQIPLYVETQMEDLKKSLSFKYQDASLVTDNIDQIEKELSMQAASYIEGTSVSTGSGKLVANTVNNSRKAYFDEPEVMEKIEAFQYINPEPNAAICVDLQNHVFRADDPELDKYTPPFHFNCDGWLRPIIKGNLRDRKPGKYSPTKAAQKSVQFSESFSPPKSARENAKRGLELRKKWNRGGTEVGVARARDLSSGRRVSRETVGRMAAFDRHRGNHRPGKKERDGGPTAGTIAWLLWGGDAGVDWAIRVIDKEQ